MTMARPFSHCNLGVQEFVTVLYPTHKQLRFIFPPSMSRTMVRICLMTHFHWVTRSYGDTFPRVSERVSGASEGASERAERA